MTAWNRAGVAFCPATSCYGAQAVAPTVLKRCQVPCYGAATALLPGCYGPDRGRDVRRRFCRGTAVVLDSPAGWDVDRLPSLVDPMH